VRDKSFAHGSHHLTVVIVNFSISRHSRQPDLQMTSHKDESMRVTCINEEAGDCKRNAGGDARYFIIYYNFYATIDILLFSTLTWPTNHDASIYFNQSFYRPRWRCSKQFSVGSILFKISWDTLSHVSLWLNYQRINTRRLLFQARYKLTRTPFPMESV
jgi:hypothetical protein